MSRKIVCLMILLIIFLTNTVFATNWVFVGASMLTGVKSNIYVDSDSVIKNGETVTFWTLTANEKPDFTEMKNQLEKHDAKQPRMMRSLANYSYYANNKLIWSNPNIKGISSSFEPGTLGAIMIETAFKYAKEGNDTGQQPPLP